MPPGGVYSACVRNWSLHENTFPSGLKQLSEALTVKWLLYVPFWCPDNVYSDQFRWLTSYQNESNAHLRFSEPHPDDALRFYRMLFDYGAEHGMVGFENDYLDYNYLSMPFLRRNYGAANKWLAGINTAALERDIPVQICMALPSDAMASVQFNSMTNVRSSTDYGINDDRDDSPVQPGGLFSDSNFNIGGSSLLAWALGLRPSKDIFWSSRPANCHGNHTDMPQTCGRWGAHTNAGSNCELNAIVATLSTGPLSLADKAYGTNETVVRRCIRRDGRILQPDRPATAVDSMFAQSGSRLPPSGQVWTTSVTLAATAPPKNTSSAAAMVWHYVLSVDVKTPWQIHGSDFYPMMVAEPSQQPEAQLPPIKWVAHSWFHGHGPTPCTHGSHAVASGCISKSGLIESAADIPPLHNTRPIMVVNDTNAFDLMELAPVASNGWVLLGEVGRYVRVSKDRFDEIVFPSGEGTEDGGGGIRLTLSGSAGEVTQVTALQPLRRTVARSGSVEWVVQVKEVQFSGDRATVVFGGGGER